MAVGYGVACPKPPKRKTLKGRKLRAESKVTQQVRAACVARDGDCRLTAWLQLSDMHVGNMLADALGRSCGGESEWAHMHSRRRSKTRGMAPEVRHDTQHSLMLCTFHHGEYDAKRLKITALTRKGADGPLKFTRAK